jgi:hypothetical protein
MDERKEFERWFEGHCLPCESNWFERDADGDYTFNATGHAWDGWQARAEQSRAECEALRKYKAAAMLMVEDARRYQFLLTQSYEFWKRIGFTGCPQDQSEAIDDAMASKEIGNGQ